MKNTGSGSTLAVHAIVVAAGKGERLGGSERKAGVSLGGAPIARWALQALSAVPGLASGALVVHAADVEIAQRLWIPSDSPSDLWRVFPGGRTRHESVGAGLDAAPPAVELVLIHDAARPLVAAADVRAVVETARIAGAAILAARVADTLKRVENNIIVEDVPRAGLWQAQTPQVFQVELLRRGRERSGAPHATDDAASVTALGVSVRIVESRFPNPKITHPADLRLAERVVKNRTRP